jgi:hypothetical protein
MANLQEVVNRRNPVTVYSPTRVLSGARANAGTARRVLSQRAAPAWASQSAQGPAPSLSLGGGGAPQAAMPNTAGAMGGGTNIEQMLARARQVTDTGQQDQGGGGGLGGFLGSVVNSAPGRVAMGALTALDYPRRIVASGVQEAADAFNGGDASWDDFVSQVHEGIGFGDILGSTGNIWLDRGLGFIGDVALDPLTYVAGAGVLANAGREGRAGLAARVLELGMGEDLSQRVGKLGIHALSDAERDVVRRGMIDAGGTLAKGADKIKDAGYYFRFPFTERPFRLPGSAIPDRLIGGTAARARMGIATSPLGGWLRHRNADEVMVQALDRLVAGKGPLSVGAAGEAYNWYQAFRLGMNMSQQEANAALKSMIDAHGIEGLRGMVDVAEREGGTAINGYFDRMAKVMEDMGINHGRVKPDVAGEGIHYVPHYYTDQGKEFLGKQTATSKAMAETFGAGHSLEDYSPSLMKRHFVGRSEPYKINGQDFNIRTGTIDEINAEFRRVTGEQYDLLETDFTKIAARYGASVGEDVGTMTAVQRLLKSKSGMLRSREDHEVLKELVDDAKTKLATENKKSELDEALNHIGHEIGVITEEISRRTHVATDALTPRLQGVIDELSSLGQDAQFRLTHALDTDSELARAAGVTSLGGQTNPYGQLRAALDAERARALDSINRLAAEHVSLQRNAQLQRSALLSELARTPTAAFALDAPRYFGDLQRYQQLSRQLAEAHRDADAMDSLQGLLIDAATKADRARGLAENDAFLTQFIPGPEGVAAQPTREIVGWAPAYQDPRMSTEAIYGRANTDRAKMLTDDYALANSEIQISPEFESVRREYETKLTDIRAQSQRVSEARLKVERAHQTAAPQLQGARQKIEGLEVVRAGKLLDLESLDGVSGVNEERLRLRNELREFDAGPLATARADYDELRAPLTQAKTDLEAQGQALARQQNQLLEIARRMDDEMYYSGARQPEAAVIQMQNVPARSMSPEEHARARALLDADTKAHAAAERNGRLARARAARTADTAELEQVDSQLRSMVEGWTAPDSGRTYQSTLVDEDGNIVLRDTNERANYEEALNRDEAQRNFDYAQNELDARRAELHAGDVDETFEGGAREELMARIHQLEAKVETFADQRDQLNARIARRQRQGAFYPDVEGTQNRIARAYALADRKARLAKRIRRATSITERVDPGYRSRSLRIAAITEDLAEYDASVVAERTVTAANIQRESAAAAARTAAETNLARPHIFEAETRRIADREARQLGRRSSLVGFIPEWGEVAPLDVDSMGLRAFTPEERLQWEHARALVSEAENFPGGRRNDIVKAAQARIDELRPKIGYGEGAYDYNITQTDYGDLRQAADEIDASRRAFSATPEERKLIDAPINLRGQGGDTSIARRGRRARRMARWIDKRVLPELEQRGAIGPGSELLGRADVAAHYRGLMAKLQGALNMKGREATMFSIAAVEQASADLNRLSEIMLRYRRALESGLEPSPSLGAFITERVYKRETDALVKEIAEGDRRLAARATSGRTAKARAKLAASLAAEDKALPERLSGDMISAEEAAEIRHLAKEAAYKDAIKRDRAVIDEIEQRRAIGDFSSDDKATRTRARNRIARNTRELTRHQALPIHTGLVSDVVDNVAATIDNAIVELDNSVSGLNDVRSTMGSASRINEKLNSLRAQHAQTEGWVASYSAGNDRLAAAIKRAEANGETVVRYRPTQADDFMMTIEQAEAALESGSVPEYLHEQIRQAIAKAKRSRRMPSGPVMTVRVGEKEELRTQISRLLAMRRGPGIDQGQTLELERATERLSKIEKFEQAFPDAVEDVNPETGVRKLRSRRSLRRDVQESEVTRFASEQGVSPRDVISSKVFRTAGPAGMETMPLEDARAMWTANTKSIAERRASLDTYTEHIAVLDGTANDDIAITRAILDDQAAEQLPNPDDLERTIAEIQNRAGAETRALDPNEQVSMSDLGAAIRGETEIEVAPGRELTKEEQLSIQTLQERANAIRKYGQMTPEQLAGAQAKLDEKLRNVERYRNEMGDRFDMADAAIDDGQRYFEDLVAGRRNPTTRDVELMRNLLGAEGGEYAATMLHKLNDLLGLSYSPTRKDLDFLTRKLGRQLPPLPAGGSRTLLMSRYDPSPEDLRRLWEDLRDIPAVLLDETQAQQRVQWMQGVDALINPKVPDAPRTLNPDELGSVFAELEMYFKGTQVLESMKRRVHELADEGLMVTDQDLRGTIGQALVKSAQVHRDDGIQNVLNMLTYLGISFPANTPGFSGKLQALGYSMSRQDFNEATLRSFVEKRMGELGLPIDSTLTHLQTQRKIRLQRLRNMRVGLAGTVRNMPPGLDPRQLFEEIGRSGENSISHFDAELARFKEIQVPRLSDEAIETPGAFEAPAHLAEIVAEREARLTEQIDEARAAGDMAKVDELSALREQLDGRNLVDPEDEPALTGELDRGQPGPATGAPDYERQVADAEGEVADARKQRDQASAQLAAARTASEGGPNPNALRNPDTPEGLLSAAEIISRNQEITRLAGTMPQDQYDKLVHDWEVEVGQKIWRGEPPESIDAARDALSEEGGFGDQALEAAQSKLNQAELALSEAESKVVRLRRDGAATLSAPETPAEPLGQVDQVARDTDPDEALTFDQADAEYRNALSTVEGSEDPQEAAHAAARARKMADLRARLWPAREAELKGQRNQLILEHLGRVPVEDRTVIPKDTVTWEWTQVVTKGVPNQRMIRRSLGTGRANRIVADVTGLASTAGGPFRRDTLPTAAARIGERMAPAEEVRQTMLEAARTADVERAEIEGTLAAYDGRDPRAELARLARERAEAKAAIARLPGEEIAERRTAELNEQLAVNQADAQDTAATINDALLARSAELTEAQQRYTENLATVNRDLAETRTRIANYRAAAEARTSEANKMRATLEYQGISHADLTSHLSDLRELNASRAALPDPADQADIDMIAALLDNAAEQSASLTQLEGRKVDFTQQLADFKSGAASVEPVMKKVLADGWSPIFKELAQGSDAVVAANDLATALTNLTAGLRKPETWGLIDDYTRFFKTYATATPGFHVRNMLSGVFMNLVDNVRVREMRRAPGIWRDFTRNPTEYMAGLAPDSDIRRALMVVFGSGASGVFHDVGGRTEGLVGTKAGKRVMDNFLTRWNQRMGSRVEGTLRLSMALDSMTKGQSVGAALDRVTRYHFDYTRLSSLDRQARRLIPFWTFMSRNLPLQIESMWLRPRTYLQYQSFVRNFGEAADPLTPEYWLSQGAFTMDQDAEGSNAPWYLAPDLPHLRVAETVDAIANRDVGKAIGANINPLIMAPAEAFGFHRKIYTGQEVNQEYNEPSTVMKGLLPLFALLGGTQRGGTSGDVLLDDRYAHVARSLLPMLNLAERLTDTSGTREGRTDETVLRTLGAPVYQLTDTLRSGTRRSANYDRRDAARSQADLARK